uniref:Sec1 family domain-containing protein 1 n=1 Tax=Panagrellus redivivus TaxID=6233 RepID=A0A7E4WDZ4_PANRE
MHRQSAEKVDNIRTRQIASLKQILNLNQPVSASLANEPTWKVLILDKYAQDIIAPLIPVKVLRENGVTLHFLVNSVRETLPDVPAVYFISPTDENIQYLCEDLKKALYDSFYINLIYPISRPQLESIAASAVNSGTMSQVQKLTDQYLSFIALEDDLFMLRRYSTHSPFTFQAINDPSISPEDMDKLIDNTASGLFAVCATLGIVPIIKCLKDNAAEQVAIKLNQKIRDNLRDARNNLFTQEHIRGGHFTKHRPILVLADRNVDLATMLHHTWTYQALIHDILEMDLNRVKIVDANGKNRDYDMDASDNLWRTYKGSPFPIVADAVQSDLEEVKQNEKAIKDLKTSMGFDNESDETIMVFGDTTSKLSSAVGTLPELLKRKSFVELHTNVATTVLSAIKSRRFDVLFENEEKMLNGQTDVKVTELLEKCTTNDDILRVLMIHYLCSSKIPAAEKELYKGFLAEKEIDAAALRYVEQLRSFSNMSHVAELHTGAGVKTEGVFSNFLSNTTKIVMEGVKKMIPKKYNLPLTKLVDQAIGGPSGVGISGVPLPSSNGSGDDEFRYFDPKLQHAVNVDAIRGQPVEDVVVFVIGGGNYVEYQNLVDYAKNKPGLLRMTYGCTELVTPKQFTEQLNALGQRLG